jgi:hypothetical protein
MVGVGCLKSSYLPFRGHRRPVMLEDGIWASEIGHLWSSSSKKRAYLMHVLRKCPCQIAGLGEAAECATSIDLLGCPYSVKAWPLRRITH